MKIYLIILLLIPMLGLSQTVESNQDGDWGDTNTWGSNSEPGNGDDVIIKDSVNMTSDISELNSLKIDSTGILNGDTTWDLEIGNNHTLEVYGHLEVCSLKFCPNSIIRIYEGASVQINCKLTNQNSDNVIINGSVIVDGEFENKGSGDITGNGSIVAESFDGTGTTFGHNPTRNIPDSTTISEGSLPVELIDFSIDCFNNNIRLNWITESEINNDYFIIEKSDDAKNWEHITTIMGMGNSNIRTEYQYLDSNQYNHTYYRLSQVDYNGEHETFNIVYGGCHLKDGYKLKTPIKESEDITIFNLKDEDNVTVFTIYGQTISQNNLKIGLYIVYINNSYLGKLVVY